MTVWNASAYWQAWVADCGAYIGPDPVPHPPVEALGAYGDYADEIDYYVTDDSLTDVVNGTGTGDSEGTYRYWNDPTSTATGDYGTGTLPSGAHLYVIVYAPGYPWPTAAPAPDALSLVPASLVAGGTLDAGFWTGSTAYFSGWAADMGEYIGPWPMMPPPNVDGGSGSYPNEIDFFLMLPNPTDPTNVAVVGDGSYASQVWKSFRYLNDPGPPDSYTGYDLDEVGGATVPTPTDTPPTGYHLYVSAIWSGEPPYSPGHYVPTNYTALGTCPNETLPGGWSSYLSNVRLTREPSRTGQQLSLHVTHRTSAATNIVPVEQSMMDAGLAHTGWSAGDDSGNWWTQDCQKSPTITDVRLDAIEQVAYQFHPSPSRPSWPSDLDGSLVFGIDFVDPPYLPTDIDYFDADLSGFAWDSLIMHIGGTGSKSGAASGISWPLYVDFAVQLLDALPGSSGGVSLDGTDWASLHITTTTGGDFSAVEDLGSPPGDGDDLVLLLTPQMYLDDLWDTTGGPDFPAVIGAYTASYGVSYPWDSPDYTQFTYGFDTGSWRYWLPDTVGPVTVAELKTIGENFLAGDGVTQIKSLVPGYGWVPVQRFG